MTHARVVLVDDNPAMLHQVAELLPDEFEIVDALADGEALASAVEKHYPDVVVLDITLPGASGLVVASRLARAAWSPKIVFLTVHNDPDYVRAAFEAGGSAYVLKMSLSLDLVPAIQAVLEGGRFVSASARLTDE